MSRSVAVVGGGVAGLTAAWALTRGGARVTVLEQAPRLGGKLHTGQLAGVPVEMGADALLWRSPVVRGLVAELGLTPEHPAVTQALLLSRNGLTRLPAGTLLGVPASDDPTTLRNVLSAESCERVHDETSLDGDPLETDIGLGELIRRRLGDEVVAELVDPIIGGVYAGDCDRLSLQMVAPTLAQALRSEGSLVRAAGSVIAASRSDQPVFTRFRGGVSALIETLADQIEAVGGQILTRCVVRSLERTGSGGWRLECGPVPTPQELEVDAVVVAIPGVPASRLLQSLAPQNVQALAELEYASVGLVTLLWNHQLGLPLASGVLIPAARGMAVKAVTIASQKWPNSFDGTLVRLSLGRAGDDTILRNDDQHLRAVAEKELTEIFGETFDPADHVLVTRWGGALPQYPVGHRAAIDRLREELPDTIALAGAVVDGVGIASCLQSGVTAAERLTGTRMELL